MPLEGLYIECQYIMNWINSNHAYYVCVAQGLRFMTFCPVRSDPQITTRILARMFSFHEINCMEIYQLYLQVDKGVKSRMALQIGNRLRGTLYGPFISVSSAIHNKIPRTINC